jgi:hypothetical protein
MMDVKTVLPGNNHTRNLAGQRLEYIKVKINIPNHHKVSGVSATP